MWRPSPLLGYRVASALVGVAPAWVADAGASAVGRVLRTTMQGRRATVARHQLRVRPELRGRALERAVDAAFESYAQYYIESFRLPSLDKAAIDDGFVADGFPQIADAMDRGTGCILALPHLGGWEWAGRWIAEIPYRITVVVEPLDPPELFEWFVGFRRSLGMTVVPLGPGVAAACLRALRGNEVLCLLCDRDLDGGGIPVEFFGERTTLPAGPATLALRTGAPLLPTATYFTGLARPSHRALIAPALDLARRGRLGDDVARLTQDLAHALEALIRRAPEQWHLFQPNWPSDPGYAR